jgi:hypothetical protein
MIDFFGKLGGQLKDFFQGWPTFIAVGTFLLYLIGYLSTRFYLTVLGVGADLAVLNEQYFFTGAKFAVYLITTLLTLLMFSLPLAAIVWLLNRAFRSKLKTKPAFLANQTTVAIIGIVIALVLIQMVMRKAFLLSNLLVAENLPDVGFGLERLLLDDNDDRTQWYFMGLVAATIVSAGIYLYALRLPENGSASKIAVWILGGLVLMQFLFLPINYGIYVQGRFLPRVADLGDQTPLPAGHNAWLVWEGRNSLTYLVEEPPQVQPAAYSAQASTPTPTPALLPAAPFGRKLVSIPLKDLKRIVIVKYDPIMRHIYLR